ncbi:MAG: Fe-S cluster assembly sulfur transfer protein SufU [Acidobacteriota bacterium]
MSDLRELYQEVILDHNRRPRNFGSLEDATAQAHGHNPLCGDEVDVSLRVADGVVEKVAFEGIGCAISTASASLMTEAIQGRALAEVQALFTDFHQLMIGDAPADPDALGKLVALEGVREFPMRVKCATLAWHTLQSALASTKEPVP